MRILFALAFVILLAGCESTTSAKSGAATQPAPATMATGSRIAH